MAAEGAHPARGHLPQLDGLVPTARGQGLPIGTEGHTVTHSAWPLRVAQLPPVATSHSLMVLSPLPEARVCPSGLKATL